MKPLRLAVVGATGLVGRTTLDVLQEWKIPLAALRLFASGASAGRRCEFAGKTLVLEDLKEIGTDHDAAILCTSKELSAQLAPQLLRGGVRVIDHSSQFRMDPSVPLVIPEINAHALRQNHGLFSNPNCSASVVLLPLAALERAGKLTRVIVATYQSVSGSGQDAVAEWQAQERDASAPANVYPRQIARNVFPQVGAFGPDGNCEEETKVIEEIRKILERPDLPVLTTTVRVPVHIGHSAVVSAELAEPLATSEIENAFAAMPGMLYERDTYKTPLEIAGKCEVFVSRLRLDPQNPRWLQCWVTGDNLRKGAASNAIQILQALFP